MQKIAIVRISEAGEGVCRRVEQAFGATLISRAEVAACWHQYEALVFVGAMGICVRTIAPLVEDKHTDPAVICIDSLGHHVIAVLSGHAGGANELARQMAAAIGGHEVITTQSDVAGLWALDTLGRQFGWTALADDMQQAVIAFVNRRPTALLLDIRDEGTDYLEASLPQHVSMVNHVDEARAGNAELLIVVSPKRYDPMEGILMVQYVPRVLTVGIGLAHEASPAQEVWRNIAAGIGRRFRLEAIGGMATADIKRQEPVVRLLQEEGYDVRFFSAEELSQVEVPSPSDVVCKHVGTPSVSEASAILASNHGTLLANKEKGPNYTFAIAIDTSRLRRGHIEIVGAGPGHPDLVSVRGRQWLERADLILYAGSLVPRRLTDCHKPGATVRSSADMALEEQCALMKDFYDRGKIVVRLHTGDPCIFGAIQEQMAFFDREGMSYHITPGISSFLAAAAELQSQFTIPERTQTIILTRGEGRTPMPEREKLHLLARSRSTMCIFLSAAIADDVERELLMEYPEDTPVAVCYRLTWPDQRIIRGQLKDLASIVHSNHLTLTTMLVVGEAIGNRKGLSELYNKHFTHLYRKGK